MREYSDYELNTKIRHFLDRKFAERFDKRNIPLTLHKQRQTKKQGWRLFAPSRATSKQHALTVRRAY